MLRLFASRSFPMGRLNARLYEKAVAAVAARSSCNRSFPLAPEPRSVQFLMQVLVALCLFMLFAGTYVFQVRPGSPGHSPKSLATTFAITTSPLRAASDSIPLNQDTRGAVLGRLGLCSGIHGNAPA